MKRKKIGRPPSTNPLKDRIFVLVDEETKFKLDECTRILDTTRSDIVRKGIYKMYDDLKNK